MKTSPLFRTAALWLASSSAATLLAVACSSTPKTSDAVATCQPGDTVACNCPDGTEGQGKCNDPSSCVCTGSDGAVLGTDAAVDAGPSATSLYGACAKKGSFGAPCTVPNANDITECTDPDFPYCFSGPNGLWCTRACDEDAGGFAACLIESMDAGDASAADASDAALGEAGAEEAGAEEAGAPEEGGTVDASLSDASTDAPADGSGMGCVPTSCNSAGYCK